MSNACTSIVRAPPKPLRLPAPRAKGRRRASAAIDRFEAPAHREPVKVAEPERPKPILLFNDHCAVCRRIAGWVIASDAKNARGSQLDERPIGDDPDALRALHPDLDIWDAYDTVHVLMPDGSMKVDGEAVAEVLRHLPATRWFTPVFDLSLLGWRPFQSVLNIAYAALDDIRPAFGCESCGHGPPWWAKPIEWMVKGWKALRGAESAPSG